MGPKTCRKGPTVWPGIARIAIETPPEIDRGHSGLTNLDLWRRQLEVTPIATGILKRPGSRRRGRSSGKGEQPAGRNLHASSTKQTSKQQQDFTSGSRRDDEPWAARRGEGLRGTHGGGTKPNTGLAISAKPGADKWLQQTSKQRQIRIRFALTTHRPGSLQGLTSHDATQDALVSTLQNLVAGRSCFLGNPDGRTHPAFSRIGASRCL